MCCGKFLNLPKKKLEDAEANEKSVGILKYFKGRSDKKKEKPNESTA